MTHRRGLALLAGATLALAACGSGTTGTGGGNKGTIKIGIDLPISGNDSSDGIPAENGALFAIKQANDKGGVEGYALKADVLDDASATLGKHDPQQGATNVKQFIADKAVLAMVGPFNSNVARTEMPLAGQAEAGPLTMVSPSNTGECLTQVHPYCTNGEPGSLHPAGKTNYFRVCTTDNIQGPALADYGYDKLGKKNVYILDDSETYGKGLADNFQKEWTKKGGAVAGHEAFDGTTTKDFKSFLTKAKSKNVDLLFFGGTTSNGGGLIRSQMKGLLDVPLLGGDGISDDQFIKDAGSNSDGTTYSVAAVNADKLDSAKKFLTDFKAAYPKSSDYGAYTANSYDAANVIIESLRAAIKANNGQLPTRAQISEQMLKIDYNGVIGETKFDANGDTSNKIISFYTIKGGKAEFADQITFTG
ncbi:MAG: branched-chain amino acid ABC transporter substrate-binding protein [Candidatus Dormibacteria bacterium]